jgi:hypothetical protein
MPVDAVAPLPSSILRSSKARTLTCCGMNQLPRVKVTVVPKAMLDVPSCRLAPLGTFSVIVTVTLLFGSLVSASW